MNRISASKAEEFRDEVLWVVSGQWLMTTSFSKTSIALVKAGLVEAGCFLFGKSCCKKRVDASGTGAKENSIGLVLNGLSRGIVNLLKII
jgi:hypothetical protein